MRDKLLLHLRNTTALLTISWSFYGDFLKYVWLSIFLENIQIFDSQSEIESEIECEIEWRLNNFVIT